MWYTFGLYAMALFYALAGLTHFARPQFFTRLVPLWLPSHTVLVYVSGAVEIVLAALLLFPATQALAAWGLIGMLVLYLLVHVNMLLDVHAGMGLPRWALWGRLLGQFALVGWAYAYAVPVGA